MQKLFNDAKKIIDESIKQMLPNEAVKRALEERNIKGNIYVVAIGKAAYEMAKATDEILNNKIIKGIIITKYGHAKDPMDKFSIYEAGHPVPDNNSIKATNEVIKMVEKLNDDDKLLFLVSGGGSALFESPAEGLTLYDLENVTKKLLACGCDIVEINAVRKRLSKVKAGRFAEIVYPAEIFSIVLSDVIGDRLDTIASGPAYKDSITTDEVLKIIKKYNICLEEKVLHCIGVETPKQINNAETVVTGSVINLCKATAEIASSLGYTPIILTTNLNCEAREAGKFMASIAKDIYNGIGFSKPCAIIAGGETVVHLKGTGLGGRNQEIALSAADEISSLNNIVIFSVGSDGTDGPTDAAGGIVCGQTKSILEGKGIHIKQYLDNNDAYHALMASNSLVFTGPTGTNVNDLTVILCAE